MPADGEALSVHGDVPLEVGEHEVAVVAHWEEVCGGGGESDWPDLPRVELECLEVTAAPDILQSAGPVLVRRHQQPPGGVHTHRVDRAGLLPVLPHPVDGLAGPAVPEDDLPVLPAGHEHRTALPAVKTEGVACVSLPGLNDLPCAAVSEEDLVLTRPGWDESLTLRDPAAVPHRPLVHRQRRLQALRLLGPHPGELHCLVIAACGQHGAVRRPTGMTVSQSRTIIGNI